MASHHVIDAYLAELARRLPPDVIDELADGLAEAYHCHVASGLSPADAAAAATTDFGDPSRITAEFARQSRGRRTALAMLATGPVFAVLWGASLVTAQAWTWNVPAGAIIAYATALLTVVAAFVVVATSHSYPRAGVTAAACVGLIALDAVMLVAVGFVAPTLSWPMIIAVPASFARITVGAHQLRDAFVT